MSWTLFWQLLILVLVGFTFFMMFVESIIARITEYKLERINRLMPEIPELYYSSNRDSEGREM